MTHASRVKLATSQAVLYYVRLKTHGGHPLFEQDQAEQWTADSQNGTLARIVADELNIAEIAHSGITLCQWVIEPASLHLIVSLTEHRPNHEPKGKPQLLTAFVAGLKTATAKRISLICNQLGTPVWQRSYSEQIIDDDNMRIRLEQKLSDSTTQILSGQ